VHDTADIDTRTDGSDDSAAAIARLRQELQALDDVGLQTVLAGIPLQRLASALKANLQAAGVGTADDDGAADAAERRHDPRVKNLRRGKVIYNNEMSVVDCDIRDMSEGGCRVHVETTLGIPDYFELRVVNSHIQHDCTVVWRKADTLGLAFTD